MVAKSEQLTKKGSTKMSYLNGITEVNNTVVTGLSEQMTMFFSIEELDERHSEKLKSMLELANCYEGYFKLHIWEGVIKYISYETDYSDDWLCVGVDTFALIIENCVNELLEEEALI